MVGIGALVAWAQKFKDAFHLYSHSCCLFLIMINPNILSVIVEFDRFYPFPAFKIYKLQQIIMSINIIFRSAVN